MKKKVLSLLLASVMVFSMAGCGDNAGDESSQQPSGSQSSQQESTPESESTPDSTPETGGATYENKVILGSITDLSGDFRDPGWGASTAGASDLDIYRLTVGYATMETNQGGAYVWNETAVKDHSVTNNDDGTATYTVELNEGLTFSDGTPITAQNYLASALSFSTPVSVEAGRSGLAGQAFVGFEAFNAYDGTNDGQDVDGVTASKVFSGVRLLSDYSFSLTVTQDYAGYYYGDTYGLLSPAPMGLFLGEGVEVLDDGEGAYLSDNYYEKSGDNFVKAAEILANRYDLTKYPFSGPYVLKEYDDGTKQATLTINPEFKGNFEGQTPSIETVVYVKIIEETQLDQLQSGVVDVVSEITGGEATRAALALVDGENFVESHYQRAGYGKIQFDCDFSPTMFTEVRQAIAYLLNRTEFCQSYTGGYGVVVDGPYTPDFDMWQAVQDDIELIDYSFSPDTAKKVLEEGGWVYNSKGEAYVEGADGVDAVRYKKLTAEEADACDGVNKTYASVSNTDGVTYQTVEINGEYYMPLVINWFNTTPNPVTDLLVTSLANSSDVAAAGMVIRSTTGDFTTLQGNIYREASYGYLGTPTYGMYNLATGWSSAVYDYAYNWSLDPDWFFNSTNKVYDEYDKEFPYDLSGEKLTYEQAVEASGGKLGMDYLSMAMVYNATTTDEYNQWWMGYIERWNQLLPDIPLYSNYYYNVYNAKIENLIASPFFGPARAIIYANVKGH